MRQSVTVQPSTLELFDLSAFLPVSQSTLQLFSLSTRQSSCSPPFCSSTCEPFYPSTLLLLNFSTFQPVSHYTPPPLYLSILQSVSHSTPPLLYSSPFQPVDPPTVHPTVQPLCLSTPLFFHLSTCQPL